MAEIRDSDSGASNSLALLVLAGWIALVAVLSFLLLTGRATAANGRVQATPSNTSIGAATPSDFRFNPTAFKTGRSFDRVPV